MCNSSVYSGHATSSLRTHTQIMHSRPRPGMSARVAFGVKFTTPMQSKRRHTCTSCMPEIGTLPVECPLSPSRSQGLSSAHLQSLLLLVMPDQASFYRCTVRPLLNTYLACQEPRSITSFGAHTLSVSQLDMHAWPCKQALSQGDRCHSSCQMCEQGDQVAPVIVQICILHMACRCECQSWSRERSRTESCSGLCA